MPTICLEGVCVIVQIIVHIMVGLYLSTVQLHIPPILVQVIIKRNRPHHSECCVLVWNVIGEDANDSGCGRSIALTRAIQHGFSCGKTFYFRQKRVRMFISFSKQTVPLQKTLNHKGNTTLRTIFVHSFCKSI